MIKKILIGLILTITIVSCAKKSIVRLYSLDNTNCVTIITIDTIRYVIAGDNKTLPNSNYIKIDISDITELNNCIWICWLNNKGWEMVIDKSKIIENRLDTNKYIFNSKLLMDKNNIPIEIKFRKENCAIFDYYSMKLSPDKGATVKIN
jgi:hypothetical protein